jgi:DNA-3-methyladenine glycosylase I
MSDAMRTFQGEDGRPRCTWCAATPLYQHYHDQEWGRPVVDDTRLFEKLCLEGFQSGLSWLTILNKRDNFRRAFAGFDFHQLAHFGEAEVKAMLLDAGIVRHRGKIESSLNNARHAVALQGEFGSLAAYFWRFEEAERAGGQADAAAARTWAFRATSPASIALSRDLKRRGFSFVGPTTAYAFMQAMGLVNDHFPGCAFRELATQARMALGEPAAAVSPTGQASAP